MKKQLVRGHQFSETLQQLFWKTSPR
nr:unnamed protein product [Callosobruchus chinensis]